MFSHEVGFSSHELLVIFLGSLPVSVTNTVLMDLAVPNPAAPEIVIHKQGRYKRINNYKQIL